MNPSPSPMLTEPGRLRDRAVTGPDTGSTAPQQMTSSRRTAPRLSPFGPSTNAPTSGFEVQFRTRLVELGGRRSAPGQAPRRSTVTAVVTALRSAVEVDQVLSVARGLTAEDLAAAYHFVDGLRARAADALDELAADPTVETFERVEPQLRLLMPHPAATLRSVADERPRTFPVGVADVMKRAQLLDRAADDIEARISKGDPDWRHLVAELDDGRNLGVFHQPSYRPRRVGDIMPLRLASLLGETPEEDDR